MKSATDKLVIDGIEVNAETIIRAIRNNYPNYGEIDLALNGNLYGYMFLFSIRVETCNLNVPDDVIGAFRYKEAAVVGDNFESIVTSASVDPTSKYLTKAGMYSDARRLGGTAWIKEGQHLYYYRCCTLEEQQRRRCTVKGCYPPDSKGKYPAFNPKGWGEAESGTPGYGVQVYRWIPSYEGEKFETSKAKLSWSTDCLIHRSWGSDPKTVSWDSSAGCQVLKDNETLWDLAKWAVDHLNRGYSKYITYTVLTKEQFVEGNRRSRQKSLYFNFKDALQMKFGSGINTVAKESVLFGTSNLPRIKY